MKQPTAYRDFSDREFATVMAALRYWQRHCAAQLRTSINRLAEDDVATNGGTLEALTADEIDALCLRLNTSTEPDPPVIDMAGLDVMLPESTDIGLNLGSSPDVHGGPEPITTRYRLRQDVAEFLHAQLGEMLTGRTPQTAWFKAQEAQYEAAARAKGWCTIDEGGWAGNLICHKDRLDDRAGPEYGSWKECCEAENINLQSPAANSTEGR